MSTKLITLFLLSILVTGCGKSTAAQDDTANGDRATAPSSPADAAKSGSIPAGCYLRANIDGKKWEATEMNSERGTITSIIPVQGSRGDSLIAFTVSGMRADVGTPLNLSDTREISYLDGKELIIGARQGQIIVTKMDDQFTEGIFNFTAEKDGRRIICTNGEFRVLSPLPSN